MPEKVLIAVPFHNNSDILVKSSEKLKQQDFGDVLIIDDGSASDIYSIIKIHKSIRFIRHEMSIGPGGSLISAYKFARDNNYDVVVILDPVNLNFMDDIPNMLENMDYGFDVVTCSRILENFDHDRIAESLQSQVLDLSGVLNQITGFDITDPLSGIIAFHVKAIESMELTEFSHAVYLQIWIQSAYYGLTVIEIPTQSEADFGREFALYEDPIGYFLAVMETEKYLYTKGSIN